MNQTYSERYNPQPGQTFYLHLSDLLMALKRYSTNDKVRVLDYGCRTSPYRLLFPNAEFVRADLAGEDNVEYVIDSQGRVNEESEHFDYILLTQVLAHVKNTQSCLRECNRLLKRGGSLLVSTHGTYWDAPCPTDFWRWTADGLKEELQQAGFEVLDMQKATTGGRALMFLMDFQIKRVYGSRRHLVGMLLWLLNRILSARKRGFHLWCDRYLHHSRVTDSSTCAGSLYIALVARARKM